MPGSCNRSSALRATNVGCRKGRRRQGLYCVAVRPQILDGRCHGRAQRRDAVRGKTFRTCRSVVQFAWLPSIARTTNIDVSLPRARCLMGHCHALRAASCDRRTPIIDRAAESAAISGGSTNQDGANLCSSDWPAIPASNRGECRRDSATCKPTWPERKGPRRAYGRSARLKFRELLKPRWACMGTCRASSGARCKRFPRLKSHSSMQPRQARGFRSMKSS